MLQIIKDKRIHSGLRIDLCTAILAAEPGPKFLPVMLQITRDTQDPLTR
jgi:hypothetical protein